MEYIFGVCRILNFSDGPLPGRDLTRDEARQRSLLQRRSLLVEYDPERKLEPLSLEEQDELVALQRLEADRWVPTVGRQEFPFEPGQSYIVKPNVAQCLVKHYGNRLRIMAPDEQTVSAPVAKHVPGPDEIRQGALDGIEIGSGDQTYEVVQDGRNMSKARGGVTPAYGAPIVAIPIIKQQEN